MWLKDNQIEAILFDLDGTLLDTSEGIMNSLRYTLGVLGLSSLSDETIRKFIGPPIQESLQKYAGLSTEAAQEGANVFRDYYKSKALYEARLYDGIIPLMEWLKKNGYKIAVATYKREDYAIDILRHFGLAEYCSVIHGADNMNKLTKTDIINLCCTELGVKKERVLLIGDTEHDAKGAAVAGVKFCAVTWGFGYKNDETSSAYPIDLVCNMPKEIIE